MGQVWAYDFSAENDDGITLYYNEDGDNAIVTYKTFNNSGSTDCTGDVKIPSTVSDGNTTYTVTQIGSQAFYYSEITSVIIPASVTYISSEAFRNCSSLKSVTILSSAIEELYAGTFSSCESLEIFYAEMQTAPTITANQTAYTTPDTFSGVSGATLNVPAGSTSSYTDAGYSQYFTIYEHLTSDDGLYYSIGTDNIVEIIASIDGTPYSGEVSISTTIGDYTVSSIASDAFSGCSDLIATVDFSDPNSISIEGNPTNDKVGTLNVPAGYTKIFEASNWGSWFDVNENLYSVNGEDYTIYCNFTTDNTAEITSIDAESTDITIPENINGYTVESLDLSLFSDYKELSLTIANTQTKVELTGIQPESISPLSSVEATLVEEEENDWKLYVGDDVRSEYGGDSSWYNYFTIMYYATEGEIYKAGVLYYQVTSVEDSNESTKNEVAVISNASDPYTGLQSFTIPETITVETEVTFYVTSIAVGAFTDIDITEVTIECETPPTVETGAFNVQEPKPTLNVPTGYEDAYVNSNWGEYFTIANYVYEGTIYQYGSLYYVVTDNENKEVMVTRQDENSYTGLTGVNIPEVIEINEDEYKVVGIATDAFADVELISVTVNIIDPSTFDIESGAFKAGNKPTLYVQEGYEVTFADAWGDIFTVSGYIVGTTFTIDDFTYTITNQYDYEVDLTSFNGDDHAVIEQMTTTYNDEPYTVTSIAEGAFTQSKKLRYIILKVSTPEFIVEEDAFPQLAVADSCVLWVPRHTKAEYIEIDWVQKYFYGKISLDTDTLIDHVEEIPDYYIDGIYYNIIEENYDTEGLSLKAEHSITLEVANGPTSYEGDITIPRTIDLGEDAGDTTVGYVTSMTATAFKECHDLTSVTLEANIPVENAEALKQVPESCVIYVVEDKVEEYQEMFSVAGLTNVVIEIQASAMQTIGITTDKVEVARYNSLGQKISAPQRGINIIKYSDNTVEKVLVK